MQEPVPHPVVSALTGGAVGLVVMFFPPHFITLFFAPFVGGVVSGMRGRARGTDALIMCAVVATLITSMAFLAAALMIWLSSGSGAGGMGAELAKMKDDSGPLALLAGAGLWGYAAVGSFFGALIGGYLKRMG